MERIAVISNDLSGRAISAIQSKLKEEEIEIVSISSEKIPIVSDPIPFEISTINPLTIKNGREKRRERRKLERKRRKR